MTKRKPWEQVHIAVTSAMFEMAEKCRFADMATTDDTEKMARKSDTNRKAPEDKWKADRERHFVLMMIILVAASMFLGMILGCEEEEWRANLSSFFERDSEPTRPEGTGSPATR